jgi:hypothetical protein
MCSMRGTAARSPRNHLVTSWAAVPLALDRCSGSQARSQHQFLEVVSSLAMHSLYKHLSRSQAGSKIRRP